MKELSRDTLEFFCMLRDDLQQLEEESENFRRDFDLWRENYAHLMRSRGDLDDLIELSVFEQEVNNLDETAGTRLRVVCRSAQRLNNVDQLQERQLMALKYKSNPLYGSF